MIVLGHSQAVWCSPTGGPRSDRTYAQWLRRLPTRLGTAIDVVNASFEVADVRQSAEIWSSLADQPPPDVLLIHLGSTEAFSRATPHWLWHLFLGSERHAGLHHRAFERARPQLWRVLRAYQRRVDTWMGVRGSRLSPQRFEQGVKDLVLAARSRAECLVLLADVVPLERMARNTPSAPTRLRLMHDALVRVVDDLDDPSVQLVPIPAVVDAVGGVGAALPDGYHFNAEVHRHVAELLRDAVSSWEEGRRGSSGADEGQAPEELDPPLRITVITDHDLVPAEGEGGTRGSYPSLLAGMSLALGGQPEVFTVSRVGADVRLAVDVFQPAVQQVTPEVVVIHVGTGNGRMSAGRFRRELLIAVRLARRVSSPLVLIVDEPGASRAVNEGIGSVVAALGPDEVRRVRLSGLVDATDAPGDRDRLSGRIHRQLAELILHEIDAWQEASLGTTS